MWVKTGLSAIGGLAGGAALAAFLVFGPFEIGGVRNGPWQTNLLIGSVEATPLLRSIVARRGLLALKRSEATYFTAWEDSSGARLDERCTYEVIGPQPAARWWSLTLYAEDDFLARNANGRHSVNGTDITTDTGSEITVSIGGTGPDTNLSTENGGAFSLTLRLYHPDQAVLDNPAAIVLPRIDRLLCEGPA